MSTLPLLDIPGATTALGFIVGLTLTAALLLAGKR